MSMFDTQGELFFSPEFLFLFLIRDYVNAWCVSLIINVALDEWLKGYLQLKVYLLYLKLTTRELIVMTRKTTKKKKKPVDFWSNHHNL